MVFQNPNNKEGHIATCRVLIDLGANPHQPDKCGRTPLRVAEKAGHQQLASILAKTPPVPLPTIRKSFSDLGGSQDQTTTNSSGVLSDQVNALILIYIDHYFL